MKRYILLLLTAILALSAFADEADEPDNKCVIKSFVFVATVHEDNTWSVTEKVVASFLEPRHGIYQYIDSRYDDLLDNELYRYYIDVTDVSVPTFTVETKEQDFKEQIKVKGSLKLRDLDGWKEVPGNIRRNETAARG